MNRKFQWKYVTWKIATLKIRSAYKIENNVESTREENIKYKAWRSESQGFKWQDSENCGKQKSQIERRSMQILGSTYLTSTQYYRKLLSDSRRHYALKEFISLSRNEQWNKLGGYIMYVCSCCSTYPDEREKSIGFPSASLLRAYLTNLSCSNWRNYPPGAGARAVGRIVGILINNYHNDKNYLRSRGRESGWR